MKIMHLITGLRRAGAEGMLLKLLQQIDKARFTSSVVALSADDEIADEIRNLGVPVHVLGIGRRCGAVAGGYRLFRLVRREKPEVLQTWLYQADFAGLAISWLVPKVKLIWNVRSTRIDSAHFPLRNRILPKLLAATSGQYYGAGYQDMQKRVPHIGATCHDLDWKPQIVMRDALSRLFTAYRADLGSARTLVTASREA